MKRASSSALLPYILSGSILLLSGCEGAGPSDDRDLGNNLNWAGTYLRSRLVPFQEPELGEYSSRSATVIQQHVMWAQEAEIDFFAVKWRGYGTYGHTTLVDYLLTESSFDDMQWCLLYETPLILAGSEEASVINLTMTARDTLISHLLDFRSSFFSTPNYLQIDGRPVIILRQSRKIAGEPWIALNAVRQAYSDSTGGETYYLIGDEAIWGSISIPNTNRIRAMDAITGIDLALLAQHDGYPQGTGFISDLTTVWETYAAASQGLDSVVPLFPMVWPGFNDAAYSLVSHPVIAREMSTGITQGGTTYAQIWNEANYYAGTPAVVLLNSFNAWHHDTQVEPVADNRNSIGTTMPTAMTGGIRYFPYLDSFLEATVSYKGNVLLGAIYEVWYDSEPPSGF
jgi:hypothetical protein